MVNKIFITQQMTDSPIYYLLDIKGAEDNFTFILADQMSKCWAERMNGLLLALVIVVVLGTRFMAPRGFQDGNCFDFITLFQHIDQTSAVQSMVQGKGNHFTNSGQKTSQMRVNFKPQKGN